MLLFCSTVQSWAESALDPDKILLLHMKLMLNTDTKYLGVAFTLKAMPKLDHLRVLFQDLRVEGSRCFDVVADCSLLHHIQILVWIPFPICALLRKNIVTDS